MNKHLKTFVSYSYLITCLLLYIKYGNQFIVIEPCDKNRLISIINTKDYFTKSYIHLQDHNTYKSLSLRPTKANSPRCSHSSTLYAFTTRNRRDHNVISTNSQEPPRIYFLWTSKIQKLDFPLVLLFSNVTVWLTIFHFILPILSKL